MSERLLKENIFYNYKSTFLEIIYDIYNSINRFKYNYLERLITVNTSLYCYTNFQLQFNGF